MKDAYRLLAPFYSQISGWVFGENRKEANRYFLEILPFDKVLMIGGGDGSDYQFLSKKLSGDYWERSQSMLALASRNLKETSLDFHLGHFSGNGKYDLICLPFVLDSFKDEELEVFLKKITVNLKENGRLVFSDFFPPVGFRQKVVHGLMIGFHRLFSDYRRKEIPEYSRFFEKAGWQLLEEKSWKGGWIKAQVYELAD
ncbi:methyltransferase domain-containing protein [Algoriphagus taiwanensis]|uniref:Methyltransferase domain-containing protein n=1 Tax=Algoriphagus taiwanensis TaxID=1445656 RepID=A0ABQ6PV44_9BACT|nr:hypothetical protein Ataiwa_01070 [Algoriphagus taiwanensis]